MNTDIRLAIGFWHHPKTKRLIRHIGLEGVRSLQILWCWVAQYRPDGNISDLDSDDIEAAADWNGDPGSFYEAIRGRWLEETTDGLFVHDWGDHNSWAAEADDRSNESRLLKLAQVNKEVYEALVAQGCKGISKQEYAEYKKLQANSDTLAERNSDTLAERLRCRSGPAPAPAPAPAPKEKERSKQYAPSCDENLSPSEPAAAIQPSVPPHKRVNLDPTTYQWHGITQADIDALSSAYPACCVSTELLRAAEWVKANPEKRKSNWYRFIVNWLRRTQDRGGGKQSNAIPQDATGGWLALVEKREREQRQEVCVNDSS